MDNRVEELQPTAYMQPKADHRYASRLLVLSGNGLVQYELDGFNKDRLYFGRNSQKCDIVLEHPMAAEVQGKIKFSDGQLYVGDMGGSGGMYCYSNGTYQRMEPKRYYKKNTGDWILWIGARQPDASALVLIFTDSESKSTWKCIPVQEDVISIGRDCRNTIVMDSPSFSRKHAAIKRVNGQYMIVDNHSMNGVYVNGERIQGSAVLREQSLIHIAGSLFLLFQGQLMYQNNVSGVSLSLKNITKTVGNGNKQKNILNHVFCDIGQNEFVAIIGGSGAGKTTVMNAMSGFDSDLKGRVYCNGIDLHKNFSSLKNMIGFVPQQDIIYENLTLRKMLYYTAKMKMPPDTSPQEMEKRIVRVLGMVDLVQHANTYIRKLSGGQKKRASIAVELLADPGLFFLDEPTSGLDPDTEQSLMHTLANLSKSEGKTIIMVTHTTQSIHLCDKVIFMGPGGKICYCGPPADITSYFRKESLVDVYNELAGNCDQWNQLYLQRYMQEQQARAPEPERGIRNRGSRKASPIKQLFVLIQRYMELIWNDKQRLLLLLFQPLGIAALLKIVANEDSFKYWADTRSILFALSCSGIWIGIFNTIQEVCKERAILKREYMGNLRLWAYILSKFVVQAFLCLVQAALLTAVFMVGMKHSPKEALVLPTPQLEIGLTMFLVIFASAAMGLIVSAFVKNADRAMAVAPFVLIIQLLFAGVIFTLEGLSEKIAYFTVSRWAMESLGNIADLNNLPTGTEGLATEQSDYYNRGLSHIMNTWSILLVITLICGVISIIVLRNLKKDSR